MRKNLRVKFIVFYDLYYNNVKHSRSIIFNFPINLFFFVFSNNNFSIYLNPLSSLILPKIFKEG
jgi:hypothetical protein